jgi:pimeloyl-ACP methyl ester carboxylesterase
LAQALGVTPHGQVEYRLEGAGPAVMVLNGGHCTRRVRLSHERLAKEGFLVLTPSRPGYDGTASAVGATAQDAADALVELAQVLGLASFFIIGISAAGPTALAMAQRHPDRVRGLILESAVVLPWDKAEKRRSRAGFGVLGGLTWTIVHTALRLAPQLLLRIMMSQLTTLEVDEVMGRMSEGDRRFVLEMFSACGASKGFLLDVEHRVSGLKDIEVPTLVMHSRNDGAVSIANADAVMEQVRGAQFFEAGSDSHLIWIGCDAQGVWDRRMEFLHSHA